MSGAGWGASLFGGGCFSLVFGLICHAVITLRRNDKEMTNDDISCFLVFSVISRKKAAAFGFPIAAAKGNIL